MITLQWQLPASALAACVDAALQQQQQQPPAEGQQHYQPPKIIAPVHGPSRVWAGRQFQLIAGFADDSIVLHVELLEHGEAVCSCDAIVAAERARQGAAPAENLGAGNADDIVVVPLTSVQLLWWGGERDLTFGSPDVFNIGSPSSELEAERKLRQAQLVHADGCLHLELKLTSPWVM
jgi:hypothetical protein